MDVRSGGGSWREGLASDVRPQDAAYLAAVSPDVVCALIALVRKAEDRMASARNLWDQIDACHDFRCAAVVGGDGDPRQDPRHVPVPHPRCDCGLREFHELMVAP